MKIKIEVSTIIDSDDYDLGNSPIEELKRSGNNSAVEIIEGLLFDADDSITCKVTEANE